MRNEPLVLLFADDMIQEGNAFAGMIHDQDVSVFTLPQLQQEWLRPGLPTSLFYDKLFATTDTFLIIPSPALFQDTLLQLFVYTLLDAAGLGEKKVIPVNYPASARSPLLN